MAQKNKVDAKTKPSKSFSNEGTQKGAVKSAKPAVAAKPEKSKTVAKQDHKPAAAKPAVAKTVAQKQVVTKPVSKGPEMKKAAAAAPAAKKAAAPSKSPAAPAAAPKAAAAQKPVAAKPVVAAAAAAATAPQAMTPQRVAAALAKSQGQKLTAPVQPASSANAQAPHSPKAIAEKTAQAVKAAPAPAASADPKKPVSQRHGFKTNEYIVYPAHGVGRIVGIEEQEIAGMSLELFVITFDKEKLTLRVPTGKLESVGMRKLADDGIVKKAMETLKGRARVKRTMWSRRAQEYVAKINSGDLVSIAEVVRDLYRSEAQPEQSYSERQLYEDALDRMAREIAAVEKLDDRGAVQRITDVLSKSARGRRMAESEGGEEASAEIKAA